LHPGANDELLSGRKLLLTTGAGSASKRVLKLVSTDTSLTLGRGTASADDPTDILFFQPDENCYFRCRRMDVGGGHRTDFARVTLVAINAGRRPVRARRNAVGRLATPSPKPADDRVSRHDRRDALRE